MKKIKSLKVSYQRNMNLGLDAYCHEYVGCKDREGYAKIKRKGKSLSAHRYVYEQTYGFLPEVVMHLCDNSCCINPNHLAAGTHKDNVADRVKKGRSAIGSKNGRSKLTEADVQTIKKLLAKGETCKNISSHYNIDPSLISQIKRGILWKHIE